jgi:hypothetical protein
LTGFSVDAVVRDHEDSLCHEFGFIFATALNERPAPTRDYEAVFVVESGCRMQEALAAETMMQTRGGPKCRTLSLDEVNDPKQLINQKIIVLAELGTPL